METLPQPPLVLRLPGRPPPLLGLLHLAAAFFFGLWGFDEAVFYLSSFSLCLHPTQPTLF